MLRLCKLSFLLLVSCRNETIDATKTGVYITNQQLNFGSRASGFAKELSFVVENPSQKSEVVTLQFSSPFSAPANIEIPALSQREIPVTFLPQHAQVFSQVLVFNGQTLEVLGTGLPVESCVAQTCSSVSTDAQTGKCITALVDNGATCSTSCIANGSCQHGVCLGQASGCDDGNPCTLDSCGLNGCQHLAVQCAAPENKCLAARCDAALGCVSEPVLDGTLCGESTCEMAHVCMGGTCQNLVPPDGFSCGKAGPCESVGRCLNKVCQQTQSGAVTPLWSYGFSDFEFDGVTDENGNIYFTEQAPTGALRAMFVSYTPQGVLRFRTTLAPALSGMPRLHLLETPYFAFVDRNQVVVANSNTGAFMWSQHVIGDIESIATVPNADGLWVVTSHMGPLAVEPTLSLFRLSSGTVMQTISGRYNGLVVDEVGHMFTSTPMNGVQTIVTFSPQGVMLPGPESPPLVPMKGVPISVANGRLVTQSDVVYSTVTHTQLSGPGVMPLDDTLQSNDFRFRSETGDLFIFPTLHFSSFSSSMQTASVPLWQPTSNQHSGLTLLNNQETLWVSASDTGSSVHRWRNGQTNLFTSCPLLGIGSVVESSFSGRYLTVSHEVICCPTCDCAAVNRRKLTTFDLGVSPVAAGWITNQGTLGHARHTATWLE